MSLFLTSGVCLGVFLSPPLARTVWADAPSALRVCLLENNLPYSARQSESEESGFDLDTARAVAEALGRPLVPVWVKNDTQMTEIDESDIPLGHLSQSACDAIFSVPGSEAVKDVPKLSIGAAYYGAAFELVGLKENPPANLAALSDTAVAVRAQTVANFVLSARKIPTHTVFSLETALDAVTRGQAGAALVWGPAAGWYLHNQPETRLTFAAGYEPPAVIRWNEHVATRKSDADLRQAIDDALTQLREAGTLHTLLARYAIPVHRPFQTTYSFAEMQKLWLEALGNRQ